MTISLLARVGLTFTATAALAGCVTTRAPDARDPLEGMNRQIYSFNDSVDRVIVRPVATAYETITPTPVRDCIHNIFSNVGDLWSATNSFLQGRGEDGINTLGRFMFNSTIGLAGCFDVASTKGAYKIPNDFGVTLGVWGFGQGPYLVLPFVGSSTVRDGVGLAGDVLVNPVSLTQIDDVRWRNSLIGLYFVDTRASLLPATRTVDRVALDPYSFVRDAYLQRRAAQVLGHGGDTARALPNYSDDEDAAPASPAGAVSNQRGMATPAADSIPAGNAGSKGAPMPVSDQAPMPSGATPRPAAPAPAAAPAATRRPAPAQGAVPDYSLSKDGDSSPPRAP